MALWDASSLKRCKAATKSKKTVLAACHAKHHRDTNAAQNVLLFWVLQDKKKRRIKYDKKAKPVRET